MFLAVDHSKQVTSDYPANCTFRESDWHILSAYWHPVAYAHEIEDKPVAAKLLDVKLVIYRCAPPSTNSTASLPRTSVCTFSDMQTPPRSAIS